MGSQPSQRGRRLAKSPTRWACFSLPRHAVEIGLVAIESKLQVVLPIYLLQGRQSPDTCELLSDGSWLLMKLRTVSASIGQVHAGPQSLYRRTNSDLARQPEHKNLNCAAATKGAADSTEALSSPPIEKGIQRCVSEFQRCVKHSTPARNPCARHFARTPLAKSMPSEQSIHVTGVAPRQTEPLGEQHPIGPLKHLGLMYHPPREIRPFDPGTQTK